MYFLVYVSSARNLFTDEQLSELLTKSRNNNTNSGITGLLLYHDGSIIQVLEGEKEAVRQIFDAIGRDKRHSGILQMIEGESENRNFPDWSMGFKHISNEEWGSFAGYFNLQRTEVLEKIKSKPLPILTVINSFMNVNIRS